MESDKIYYYFPTEVSTIFREKYLNENKHLSKEKILCIYNNESDTINLLFTRPGDNSKELNEIWIKSNRIAVIDSLEIPILFYSDLLSSSVFNRINKAGDIDSKMYVFGGYRIQFVGTYTVGTIINYGNDF